jgi:hypothetical protein
MTWANEHLTTGLLATIFEERHPVPLCARQDVKGPTERIGCPQHLDARELAAEPGEDLPTAFLLGLCLQHQEFFG